MEGHLVKLGTSYFETLAPTTCCMMMPCCAWKRLVEEVSRKPSVVQTPGVIVLDMLNWFRPPFLPHKPDLFTFE